MVASRRAGGCTGSQSLWLAIRWSLRSSLRGQLGVQWYAGIVMVLFIGPGRTRARLHLHKYLHNNQRDETGCCRVGVAAAFPLP